MEGKIVVEDRAPQPDRTLLRALSQAHFWVDDLRGGTPLGKIAAATRHSESHIRPRVQLAYLAPAIQPASLDGHHPVDLTLERTIPQPVPLDWDAQASLSGFNGSWQLPDLRAAFRVRNRWKSSPAPVAPPEDRIAPNAKRRHASFRAAVFLVISSL